jgi:hypothetical protein
VNTATSKQFARGDDLLLEEKMISRRGFNLFAPILVALLVAMPLAARDNGKNGKATSTEVDILSSCSLAGKQLKPGTYHVTADDAKVTIEMNGKVVAEAPVTWKDETSKPRNSNIVTNDNTVTEIHFNGKMRFVSISG